MLVEMSKPKALVVFNLA